MHNFLKAPPLLSLHTLQIIYYVDLNSQKTSKNHINIVVKCAHEDVKSHRSISLL